MKVREVVERLERAGWRFVRHTLHGALYIGPDGRKTVVRGRPGQDIKPGTLAALERQTGLVLNPRRKQD